MAAPPKSHRALTMTSEFAADDGLIVRNAIVWEPSLMSVQLVDQSKLNRESSKTSQFATNVGHIGS